MIVIAFPLPRPKDEVVFELSKRGEEVLMSVSHRLEWSYRNLTDEELKVLMEGHGGELEAYEHKLFLAASPPHSSEYILGGNRMEREAR